MPTAYQKLSYDNHPAFHALVRNGHSIEDASWQAGFANYSNFFRLYKKHTGMTPIQFKKQLRT